MNQLYNKSNAILLICIHYTIWDRPAVVFLCLFRGKINRTMNRCLKSENWNEPPGCWGLGWSLMHWHKAWERSSALCSANTIYGGSRSGFVVYGHKETTAAQCEMPWGGWGVGRPPGGGETELNRASIALPQAVCGCLSCWALQSKILSAMKF